MSTERSDLGSDVMSGGADMALRGDAGLMSDAELEPASVCAPILELYADERCETTRDGIYEYTPRYPLWSDGVLKRRFMYLPDRSRIDTSDPNKWIFPVGTKFWKLFYSPDGQRLETRVLSKTEDLRGEDGWTFETYVWNERGDDVTLLINGQSNVLGTQHDIPQLRDCDECHSGGVNQRDARLSQVELSDLALGFDAIQLNHEESPLNLESLQSQGLLTDEISLADATIPGDQIAQAALGYLHGNCGGCHGGAAPAKNVSMFIPLGVMTVEQTPTYQTNVGRSTEPGRRATGLEEMPPIRIFPGDAEKSALVWRMRQRRGEDEEDDAQMPPLATELIDQEAISKVSAWINTLPSQ